MPAPDVLRLVDLFESGRLVRPARERPNTVDLARALAVISGAPRFESEAGAIALASLIGEPEHLVFVLADGLGMNLVERLPPDAFLRRHLAMPIHAVFPSSTAPALTSLATGVWPAVHAVPTWFTYLPHAGLTAVLLPFAERATHRDLGADGLRVADVFPLSVQARYFRRDFRAFQPRRIAASVYTRYATGGPKASGYATLEHGINGVISRVQSAHVSTYTYVYFPDVDAAEHDDGVEAGSVWDQVLRLDSELGRLKDVCGPSARIVVSADHGQITVPDGEKRMLAVDDELRSMLRVWPPAGDPRPTCFHVRPGYRNKFPGVFSARFGEDFLLLSADEAESLRLFGPGILSPAARGRIGDFIAVPTGAQALTYEGEPDVHAMNGMHGALSAEEMLIPLVIA